MRLILVLASSALAATTLASGFAAADDRIHVTPPISREHARTIQAVRPAAELAVVPQPVAAPVQTRHVTSAAARINLADR
jgi:hypothetical protein